MLRAAASAVAAVPAAGECWSVLGAFPTALYLGGPERAVLPVVCADALLLPNAWRLPLHSTDLAWSVAVGDAVPVLADGALLVGPDEIRSVRSWSPRPVRAAAGRAFGTNCQRNARDWTAWAAEQVGRGEGLTPEGDDELCGALLVAYAFGDLSLAQAIGPLLDRTTDLSAALLRCAGDGLAVPELAAFVDAAVAGDDDLAARLRPAVHAIGHSSGPALVRGVEETLAAMHPRELAHA